MLVGGFGSGKSDAGVMKTFMMKMKYPKHKVAYYLPTYGLVRDIAFDKFTHFLEGLNISYTLNKSDKEILIDGMSSIIFRTMSEPESIVGYEVAYSLIDEADILPKDKMHNAYDKIIGRNRAIDNAVVDMVSTPEGFKFLYDKATSGYFKVIKAKTTDNKFIPDSYIESLREQYSPELLKAYIEGEFVNLTTGSVYHYFDRASHSTSLEPIRNEPLHIGQDFNVGGCVSIVFVIRGDLAIAVDEFVSNDTYHVCENILERYPNNFITVYPDASGAANKTNSSVSDLDILYKAGFTLNVPRKNGAVKDRINVMNKKLSDNRILININKCPEFAKALEQQAYDKNGVPTKFTGAATVDDYNDAGGYAMVRIFGVEKTGMAQARLSFA